MNSVVFQNSEGAPIAFLGLSTPVQRDRTCIFMNAAFTPELFSSRESEVLLPDRPTEYKCRYDAADDGWEIAFENQFGWRITVTLDDEAQGQWTAEKNGERVEGIAHGWFDESCDVAPEEPVRQGIFSRVRESFRRTFS